VRASAGIQEGDLVITTPFSFVASTNVLLFERATLSLSILTRAPGTSTGAGAPGG